MTVINCNEAQFEIDGDWEDQSVVAFAAPGPPPRIALIVTKQKLGTAAPADVIDTHVRVTSQKLRRFELGARAARKVFDFPGWDLHFTFTHQAQAFYQRQVFVHYLDLLWILTGSGTLAQRKDVDAAFEKVLKTIKFRRPVISV